MPTGFTEIFGGTTIYPSQTTYLTLVTAVNVSLSWPIEQQMGNQVVADIIDVNATVGSLSITIPDARQVTTGYTSLFNNIGSNTFTVKDSVGGTIMTVASGQVWQFYLTDNTTAAGTWRIFQYGAGASSANAAALAGAGLKAITTTLNQAMPISSHGTNYVIVNGDRAKAVVWTGGVGTFTLPDPAVVGSDWFVAIKNAGSGGLTITPAAGSIDGVANKLFSIGSSALLITDGVNYFTIGFGQAINSIFDFISIDVAGTGDYVLSGGELNRIAYRFIGVLSGNRNIIVPAVIQQYWVDNETTGAFTLTVKTALGTGVVVSQVARTILYCDGVNVVNAETVVATVPVVVAQGGTGATTAAGARTNLGVPPDTRLITAGAGLTGGGDLSADRTLDVGAGTGITVNANDVALSAGTQTSLGLANTAVQPARTLTAGAGLTGGGDLSADRTFDVGAGTGITVNVNDVAVNQAFSPTWTGNHTFTPSSGIAAVMNGVANSYVQRVLASTTSSQSFGLELWAGTSASDTALLIKDATGAVTRLQAFGDGGLVTGNATGGNQGFGTINSNGLFINGAAVASATDSRTWQDVTGSRSLGSPFTNSSGVTIQVLVVINYDIGGAGTATATLDVGALSGIGLGATTSAAGAVDQTHTFDVPTGITYQINNITNATLKKWLELRP